MAGRIIDEMKDILAGYWREDVLSRTSNNSRGRSSIRDSDLEIP